MRDARKFSWPALCIAGICLSSLNAFAAAAAPAAIENDVLKVDFDGRTGAFSVLDKRSGRLWEQAIPGEAFTVKDAMTVDGGRISAKFAGPIEFRVEIAFSPDNPEELIVKLLADEKAAFPESAATGRGRGGAAAPLDYPYPFLADPRIGKHLYTKGPGMMLPAAADEFEEIGGGLARAADCPAVFFNWLGLIEGEAGMAFYCDSFADGQFAWTKVAATPERPAEYVSQVEWLAEKGAWGYDREMRYVFSEGGGYVKLAKWARAQLRRAGLLVTLEEKMRLTPAVEKQRGAPIVWVWLEGREDPKMVREMKEQGIDNAIMMFDPNHPPYPSKEYLQAVEEAGYSLGIYQFYGRQFDVKDPHFLDALPLDGRVHYRDPGFEKYMAVLPGGELWNAGGAAVPPGDRITYYAPSARFYAGYILNDVREIRDLFPMMTMFYSDGFAMQPPFEDYSPEHPHNRRDDMELRGKAIEAIDKLGVLSGSMGNVSAWYLRAGHWSHGGMTLNEVRGIDAPGGTFDDTDPKLDPAHWEKYVMKPYPPDEKMIKYDFEPNVRLPLLELIAHDCIVSSTQWRDSCHRWGYEYWDYRDLWHILYGNVPLWNLSSEEWWRYYWRFAQCYENVLEWHKKVFGAEMVDHRFLTDDQLVQQSRFSNGWAVTVNFSRNQSYDDGGAEVAPMGFRTFQWN